jgi:hypothetical protein
MTEHHASERHTSDIRAFLRGLWLPLVTPFRDGALDETSLRRLVRHYAALPVNGLILAATTGESLTLSPEETERLVRTVHDETGPSNLPICLGLSGSDTRALLQTLERTAAWPIDFYLISCRIIRGRRSADYNCTSRRWRNAPRIQCCSTTFRTGPASISAMRRCFTWRRIRTSQG